MGEMVTLKLTESSISLHGKAEGADVTVTFDRVRSGRQLAAAARA